jgi:hypothetical protein
MPANSKGIDIATVASTVTATPTISAPTPSSMSVRG